MSKARQTSSDWSSCRRTSPNSTLMSSLGTCQTAYQQRVLESREEMKQLALDALRRSQKLQKLIKSFAEHNVCPYATDATILSKILIRRTCSLLTVNKIDARKLSPDALQALRSQTMRLRQKLKIP